MGKIMKSDKVEDAEIVLEKPPGLEELQAEATPPVDIQLVGPPIIKMKTKLEFVPGHPQVANPIPEKLIGPYAFAFDSASGFVNDYHQFDPVTPLVMVKSSFSNVLESFVADYKHQTMYLMAAAENVAKRLGKKSNLSAEFVGMCKSRAEMRLDEGQQRLMRWDGLGELMVQLPYAVVAQQGEPDNPIIDFKQSRIYVQGMIWTVCYRSIDPK